MSTTRETFSDGSWIETEATGERTIFGNVAHKEYFERLRKEQAANVLAERAKGNVYDRQLASDGRILHHLGIMLKRDEHNVATPKPIAVRVCAWCGCDMGTVEVSPAMDATITHGVCFSCSTKFLKEVA